jgi:hypothetical protein
MGPNYIQFSGRKNGPSMRLRAVFFLVAASTTIMTGGTEKSPLPYSGFLVFRCILLDRTSWFL